MNETNAEHERIERLLKQARLPEPPSPLHDRVTTAAKQAWDQTPTDVPWQVPLRRLALSAAAAVIVVSLANHLGNVAEPRAHPRGPVAASISNPDVEEMAEMVYSPSRYRLATDRRRISEMGGATLRNKMENIRAVLEELENNGIQAQPTPSGGRSRLLRNRRRLGAYS
jgi:hypothetical protein